ncbi:MAG: trypsin-like peptidase domain-containing protein [Patescibacteria group bacterium]
MYNLPDLNFNNFKEKTLKILTGRDFLLVILAVLMIIWAGFYAKDAFINYFQSQIGRILQTAENKISQIQFYQPEQEKEYVSSISYEQAIIDSVKSASPSVVSIVILKQVPVYEEQLINPFGDIPGFNIVIPRQVQKGTELRQVGSGSGFIVSADGMVLTNKHVVLDANAQYKVITNDKKEYSAKVLARDPVQDLAVVKIEGTGFPAIKLGNSDGIQIGQGAIAIGNALGKFSNTVSVGVVSGLERTISASDSAGGFSEVLENIIQTDAAINQGNSGGPLLNLKGEVIGINVAMAQGAQTIGFAIPINIAKKGLDQVIKTNKITYPFLGIRYVLVDEQVKKENGLSVDYGALAQKGVNGEPAISPDSAAQKAGLKDGDVILEINGEKITQNNSLAKIIQKYNPGDKIKLKVLRGNEELNLEATLGER